MFFGYATDYVYRGVKFNNVSDGVSNYPDSYLVFKRRHDTTGEGFWYEGVYSLDCANEVAREYRGYGYETLVILCEDFLGEAE